MSLSLEKSDSQLQVDEMNGWNSDMQHIYEKHMKNTHGYTSIRKYLPWVVVSQILPS